ncbi:MAG TPA: hypothetical protein VL400_21730, partial [Polyangiaceae bacterium]|nr:hypothetical protein [Polyangiaceae bacterium]
TLAQSLPYYTQEIIARSNAQSLGVQVTGLNLQVQVQAPTGIVPYQGQLPPDPNTQLQNRMQQIAEQRLNPENYTVKAQINIGGFKLKGSSDKGFDTDGFVNQAQEKAKTEVVWLGIGCAVVGLVVLGAAGLGWYIWSEARKGSAGNKTASGDESGDSKEEGDAADAKWDGKSPFNCGGSKHLLIKGVTAKLDKDTAINAAGNCVLDIEDSDITGNVGIQAGANAVVNVKGGKVTGKDAAAKALANAKIHFSGTKVTGKKDALGNAKIDGP